MGEIIAKIILGVICFISVACPLIIIFGRYIWPLIKRAMYKIAENTENKCSVCKGTMTDTRRDLFLIPARIDQSHEESAEYYLRNAIPLESSEQIPTGNRACYMFILQCQQCGRKEVVVQDFLRVRDQEYVKGGGVYPYEKLKDLLEKR